MKIIAVIPAHLASIRFPRKILFPFYDLPMIEHVRRRALMSEAIDKIYVATSDDEIADVVKSYGGDVYLAKIIKTDSTTDRIEKHFKKKNGDLENKNIQ